MFLGHQDSEQTGRGAEAIQSACRSAYRREGERIGQGRRNSDQDSSGRRQSRRHHGRSAARDGAVRGA